MTAPLPLLTDQEVRRVVRDDESGFGCLSSSFGRLPLRAMDVSARVIATFAQTTLRQTFVNTLGRPLEATYIFPLPDRAAVTRFVMEVAGRRVEGDIQERRQARQTYDNAIASGRRASIAEEERPGVFTIRVGNLMPGEAATITLELTGPLPVADGEVTYRFPLVVAPRYMPGAALGGENVGDGVALDTAAVPDASRISPPVLLAGFPNPVHLGITVELDAAGLPLSDVRSSLHAAYADEKAGSLVVRLGNGERLNRDFILRFRLGDAHARSSLRVLPGARGEDTFMLTVIPPNSVVRKPKDVVFVVDKSGSMGGWKMVAARRAVARMVDALGPDDRFHVIAFASGMDACPTLAGGLVEATDRNRFRAVEWLSSITAGGGTEMAAPLSSAASLLGGGHLERDRALVFVTDGQVGNESQLVKMLGDQLRGTRVFAIGIDQAVNAAFLNRLAGIGRTGYAELIENEERLDESLQRLHRRLDAPAVAELSLDGGATSLASLAPERVPDLFPGVPVTVFGRVPSGRGPLAVTVRGRAADGSAFAERVVGETTGNRALEPAWARAHVRDLEDRFDIGKEDKGSLERRIVAVSIDARVLCRFTAFVAVDHEVVNRGGHTERVVQAVEQPAGWGGPGASADASVEKRRAAPVPARAPAASEARSMQAPTEHEDMMFDEGAPAPMGGAKKDAMGASMVNNSVRERILSKEEAAPPQPAKAARRAEEHAKKPTPQGEPLLGRVNADSLAAQGPAPVTVGIPQEKLVDVLTVLRQRGEVFHTATTVIDKLRALLEELAFAGAPHAERAPVEELLRELRTAADARNLTGTDEALRKLELYCEAKLGPVASATVTGGGRRDFWR